jgi:hypothetical protein
MGHILERRKGNEKSRKRTYVRQNGRKEGRTDYWRNTRFSGKEV